MQTAENRFVPLTGPIFRHLIAAGNAKFAQNEISKQGLASAKSSLTAFMRFSGCSMDDQFIGLLGMPDAIFDVAVRSFVEKATVNARTIPAYRSRLKIWNAWACDLVSQSAPSTGHLSEMLSTAIATHLARSPGMKKGIIAKAAGISLKRLYQLRKPGVQITDTPENIRALTQLEGILGLSPGSLTSTIASHTRGGRRQTEIEADRKARNGAVPISAVRFRPDKLPARIEHFFEQLKILKTTPRILYNFGGTTLKRAKSNWRVCPDSSSPIPSADLLESRFLTIIGWLTLPKTITEARIFVDRNCHWRKKRLTKAEIDKLAQKFIGRGVSINDITPLHLVDPEILGGFLEWNQTRNGAARATYIWDAQSLLAARHGVLRQQVELAWGYPKLDLTPIDMTDSDAADRYSAAQKKWDTKCTEWIDELDGLASMIKSGKTQTARDRIKSILDKHDLMGVIFDTIQSHAFSKPIGKLEKGWAGSIYLAVWVRDQLLLRMLASNPLRNRNFREMRYCPDQPNRGNIYKTSGGEWKLRYQPHEFKNEAGAAKESYEVKIPENLWSLVEQYLFEARPVLIKTGFETDKVFLNKKGEPFTTSGLSTVICGVTGRHMPRDIDSFGIRSHAFRHIIATAWLRAHPEDYLTVALILHDSLETVLKNYAHTKPEDGLDRYASWLDQKIKPFEMRKAT